MVGFDPDLKQKLSQYHYATAGAVSGVLTRATCQPLDVIKIRFQLQVEPIRGTRAGKYHGMLQAMWTIIREEKMGALWKGHVPAQYLSVVYGISQFVTFELMTHQVWEVLPPDVIRQHRPTVHSVCGGLAGCCATVFSFPFDVIRTRLVAQGEPKLYSGMADAAWKMYQYESNGVFFRGLGATLLQVAPYTGLQFFFYTFFWQMWRLDTRRVSDDVGWVESSVCGSMAGVAAKGIVYPLDLAKKRMQVQGFHQARERFGKVFYCKGLLDCFRRTVVDEGFPGLYKGFLPSLIKAAATTGLTFCFYEQACRILRHLYTDTS